MFLIFCVPDCFSRGLVQEALGQLQGLKRRKKALEMLGAAVQAGLEQKDAAAAEAAAAAASAAGPGPTTTAATAAAATTTTTPTTRLPPKRRLDSDNDGDGRSGTVGGGQPTEALSSGVDEPAAKRARQGDRQ